MIWNGLTCEAHSQLRRVIAHKRLVNDDGAQTALALRVQGGDRLSWRCWDGDRCDGHVV